MDRETVFTKTAKGLLEAAGKSSALSRHLRAVLKQVDGKADLGQLSEKFARMPEARLRAALEDMQRDGYVRELIAPQSASARGTQTKAAAPGAGASGGDDLDLDFTSMTAAGRPGSSAVDSESPEAARKAGAERARRAAQERAEREKAQRLRAEAVVKARIEAEAQARAKAQADAEAHARLEAEEKARREADALREQLETERKAREAAERRAQEDARRRAREDAERKAREEEESRAREEAERQAREEAERRAREEAERREREEAELRAQLQAERKAREDAERRAQEDAERWKREEAERRAQEEAERKTREESERRAREEAERRAREEAERREREQAERRAQEEAERKAREESEQRAWEEAERREREEAERREREEAERRAREEAEHLAREEAERRAREEAELRAQLEAERKAREDAERRAQEEAERWKREEAERREREETERLAREEADRSQREEAGRLAREEAERRAREEAERREREEDELRAQLEAERKARDEAERRQLEDAERRQREESELREREEAERTARDEHERAASEESELKASEESAFDEKPVSGRETAEQEDSAAASDAGTGSMGLPAGAAAKTAAKARREARARERAMARQRREAQREEAAPSAEADVDVEEGPGETGSRRNWARLIAAGFFFVLIAAIAVSYIMPLDVAPYEQAAQKSFGEQVHIGSIHFRLLPKPHLLIERVAVGAADSTGRLRIRSFTAVPDLGSMFTPRKVFKSIEVDRLELPPAMIQAALWGRSEDDALSVGRLVIKDLKLGLKGMDLPGFDVQASFGAGRLDKVQLANSKKDLSVSLQRKGTQVEIALDARRLDLPFGWSVPLDEFSGKGVVDKDALILRQFDARGFGGYLSGTARLAWGGTWSLAGTISAQGLDAAKLAAPILSSGVLEGKGTYRMESDTPQKLMAGARMDGSFSVHQGRVDGVDLKRALQQAPATGGSTQFEEMTGSFDADSQRIVLERFKLSSGFLAATGAARLDAWKKLSGHMRVELRARTVQARAALAISGTLDEPQFLPAN